MAKSDMQYNRICAHCGLTWGSHRGDSICYGQCPKRERGMDWPTSNITVFADSGKLGAVPTGQISKVFSGGNTK